MVAAQTWWAQIMPSRGVIAGLESRDEVDGEAVRIPPSALIGAFLCSFPGADFRPTYESYIGDSGQ